MKWLDTRNNVISESASHPGMFIIEPDGGGFYTVNSTAQLMANAHPVKMVIDRRLPAQHVNGEPVVYGTIRRRTI